MRTRISIVKEDRIWNLRCQGYRYDSIAQIVNCKPVSITQVIRRVRNRPPHEVDPVRRGRFRAFLSDAQVEDIRRRKVNGEHASTLADDYSVSIAAIYQITSYHTYKEPCGDSGYQFNFTNRLMA
jgi:Mor family transcriptional regulator